MKIWCNIQVIIYPFLTDFHWFPTTSDNGDTVSPQQRLPDTTVIPGTAVDHASSSSHAEEHTSPQHIQALAEHFGKRLITKI